MSNDSFFFFQVWNWECCKYCWCRCHFGAALKWLGSELSSYLKKTKKLMSQCLFLHITCSFVISSAFVTSSVKVHTVAVCFSSLQYCKDWSHLALDRGACHPHTVIIPELTSPLSIELLRRCRGHKIPCSERQHWSCPSGLEVKKWCTETDCRWY